MRAVVVVEYDMDDNAEDNPLPAAVAALCERLPETPTARGVQIHLAIHETADQVLAAFTPRA